MTVEKLQFSTCGHATVRLEYPEIRTIAHALFDMAQKDSQYTKMSTLFQRLQFVTKEGSLDFEAEGLIKTETIRNNGNVAQNE